VWRAEGVHGLPAIAAPTFFPKATKNKNIWWETKTPLITPPDETENESMETKDEGDPPDGQGTEDKHTIAYIWDSMDEEDREDTMNTLQ
jgi:hypothetical protein